MPPADLHALKSSLEQMCQLLGSVVPCNPGPQPGLHHGWTDDNDGHVGYAEYSTPEHDRARFGFETAIANDPFDATAHEGYADWLDEEGQRNEAWQRRAHANMLRSFQPGYITNNGGFGLLHNMSLNPISGYHPSWNRLEPEPAPPSVPPRQPIPEDWGTYDRYGAVYADDRYPNSRDPDYPDDVARMNDVAKLMHESGLPDGAKIVRRVADNLATQQGHQSSPDTDEYAAYEQYPDPHNTGGLRHPAWADMPLPAHALGYGPVHKPPRPAPRPAPQDPTYDTGYDPPDPRPPGSGPKPFGHDDDTGLWQLPYADVGASHWPLGAWQARFPGLNLWTSPEALTGESSVVARPTGHDTADTAEFDHSGAPAWVTDHDQLARTESQSRGRGRMPQRSSAYAVHVPSWFTNTTAPEPSKPYGTREVWRSSSHYESEPADVRYGNPWSDATPYASGGKSGGLKRSKFPKQLHPRTRRSPWGNPAPLRPSQGYPVYSAYGPSSPYFGPYPPDTSPEDQQSMAETYNELIENGYHPQQADLMVRHVFDLPGSVGGVIGPQPPAPTPPNGDAEYSASSAYAEGGGGDYEESREWGAADPRHGVPPRKSHPGGTPDDGPPFDSDDYYEEPHPDYHEDFADWLADRRRGWATDEDEPNPEHYAEYDLNEQRGFEEELDRNPFDPSTHGIYGWWLKEHGQPELGRTHSRIHKTLPGMGTDPDRLPSDPRRARDQFEEGMELPRDFSAYDHDDDYGYRDDIDFPPVHPRPHDYVPPDDDGDRDDRDRPQRKIPVHPDEYAAYDHTDPGGIPAAKLVPRDFTHTAADDLFLQFIDLASQLAQCDPHGTNAYCSYHSGEPNYEANGGDAGGIGNDSTGVGIPDGPSRDFWRNKTPYGRGSL